MKKIITTLTPIALAIATLSACSPASETAKVETPSQETQQTAGQSESQRLNGFFERTFEEDLKRSPLFQSYLGKKWDYDKWDDISDEEADASIAIAKNRLETLNGFDTSKLSEQEKLSLRLYKLGIERDLANDKFRHHRYIVHQFRAAHTQVPSFLINIHRVTNKDDAMAYIGRLDNVRTYFDQVIDQMKTREKLGVFPPAWAYDQMIDASKNVISGAPFDNSDSPSTIWEDFQNKVEKLDIDDAEKETLLGEAKAALVTSVKPAYEKFINELAHQREVTPEGDGVWRLPDGDKWYQNRLNWFTTTDLTADEIHQIGLDNVERIHSAMRSIMEKVGFEGTLQEFFVFMREDDQFYLPSTDTGRQQYLDDAKKAIDEMREAIPDYFGILPEAPMVVKRVEAFREQSAGKAFYQSPAQDGSRPGIYYANLYDMKAMPTYQLEALAYHEGIPGHHMQRTIAQELEGVPQFQKFLSFTAYTEGWGLYTEELAKDMGFYQDPYSDFGRLAMELWRACRLVVDTGIHAKQWSREKAVNYLVENTPNPQYDAQKAIERYIAMPGQATAYMIGKLKIMELRDKAMTELGDSFDWKGFHDEILKYGPVPLSILEENINTWIDSQKMDS
ncbi:hypothetical protein KUC3_12070 [Alteromonas sp. KC3]|uniref:DUF885 domain-containing protein n=1 Tax=unclassified Alteromonas TaxID=2614992 RepID=UPI0019236DB5|nr:MULTISPECIES: DUF885 domain-containing protein [unclassified Alteromonas]BCO18350.1 hypothetical protein KUC3_12070 [Alteromonas sp. KC3]BCO22310.1 hypothetical protein KUC14_11790 [Alteromonas sp. KC14]